MSSLFSTDPFSTLHSPSSYEDSSPDLSVLQELEMEYGEPVNPLSDEFLTSPEQEYASPLSDTSIPPFTVTSPYDMITTQQPISTTTNTCVKQETITHHIPLIPFQSVTATRTAKKRRRFVGMSNLRGSDDDVPDDVPDDNSINSSDSGSSQSSPTPSQSNKKTTNKRAKANTDPTMGKRERNKVSASKYRKRRKMYLDTLEERTHELEAKYTTQQETMSVIESENRVLKEQLSFLKNLLNGKGQDMAILEKQLHDGFQSTSNPQQSSSIFMFVLFSCFLLFNPMSWFTSTTTTMTQHTHMSSNVHPDTTRYTGRKLLAELMDESMAGHHDIPMDMFRKDDETQQLSFLNIEMNTDIPVTSQSYSRKATTESVPMAPGGASPPAIRRVAPLARTIPAAPTTAAPTPTTARSILTSKKAYTGSPHDLPLKKSNIDIDDPIRVNRVAQPVEPVEPTTRVVPTSAAAPPAPTTATPVPPTMRTLIDLTNTSSFDTNTSQHDIHKLAHDQLYVPLVRLMGETHAQQALQSLAQGVMNIQLENQTETRANTPIVPA